MELSERCIAQLEKEGFLSISEWGDAQGTVYDERTHAGEVTIFVTDGSIEFMVQGIKRAFSTGDRFDIPPHVPYSAVVGVNGCNFVVGEMISGDW
jgi:quercetin dioxygenase-like cupin family protein